MNRPAVKKKVRYRKPKRSLRTILMIWFLLLSLVPLMFVTGYSLVKYERAIEYELIQRLRANVREFNTIISDYESYLAGRRHRYRSDQMLSYHLLTSALPQAKQQALAAFQNSSATALTLFDRDGQLVTSISPGENGPVANEPAEDSSLSLKETYIEALKKNGEMTIVDMGGNSSMDLIAYTRLDAKSGRVAGYIEEVINIGPVFLQNLEKRLNLSIMLFNNKGEIIAGSHPDFLLYQKDFFSQTIGSGEETFFDLTVRNEPFKFLSTRVKWGDSSFIIGLGASKQKARAALRNINYAFFTMLAAIGILLVFTSIVATKVIVKPVYDLVGAIQSMDVREGPVEIPVSTSTEIGVLTDSFNEMSLRIYQAKTDLEKKIKELEQAYRELKDTQARLVHSAKMASLGQLVAGIAHELNNPIGFIFSNMSHMRDYSQRLMNVIEVAEKNPGDLARAKKEVDFDYIVQDLPRLISSCEEGARRTRDIVLGLRNFSRLEEAKIKKISLQEGIEDTLRLLSGEVKNRIQVHTDFRPVPEVLCYASQLNQVFMNILTNAAQAIEGQGEIWIKLSHQPQPGKGGRAQVSIRDSGKGMPADVVEKIFDPFFTTKTVGQGTGLGLSISYGIVKKHGGDIQVRSESGKGTEFIITVPVDGPPGADHNASA